MKTLIYGSFDPFTSGHLHLCEEALKESTGLVIAVLSDPDRRYVLSQEQRVQAVCRHIQESGLQNVTISTCRSNDPIDHLLQMGCDRIFRMYRAGEQAQEVRRRLYHTNRYPIRYDLVESKDPTNATSVRDAISAGVWVPPSVCLPATQNLLRSLLREEKRIGVVGGREEFLNHIQHIWRKWAEKEESRPPAIRAVFLPWDCPPRWAAAQTDWGRGHNYIHIPPGQLQRGNLEEIAALGGWDFINLLPSPLPNELTRYG